MSSLLTVEKLKKNYGSLEAVKDLDFNIKEGTCFGLLGSNGAGKSTTIGVVTGQIQPTSGQIRVMGINPSVEPKKLHSLIGYVPDRQNFYDSLSVEQNIHIFASLYKKGWKETEHIMEKVQIFDRRKTKISKLSRGLKQRVLIARALVHNPKIMFLDEPTRGLDPSFAEIIYIILEDIKKQGTTVLLTTHLMNDVERLCDRVLFMDKGQKIEEGTLSYLKQKYSEPGFVDVKVEINGKLETRQFPLDQLSRALEELRTKGKIVNVSSRESRIQDIFVKLIGNKK